MEKKSLLNLTMKWGLIAGVISIAYTLILYIISPVKLAGFLVYLVLIPIIAMMIMGVAEKRREQEGFIAFSEALLTAFMIFFFSQVLSYIFSYIMYTVIDPELPGIIKEQVINNTYTMMEKWGMAEEEIEKVIAEISKEEFTPTVGRVALNLVVSSIFGFILSLIVGAIMKRKRPIFEERQEG